MKNLAIIIHSNVQQDLSDHLRSLEQVSGFTFSKVEGHSRQSEKDQFLSARDRVVGYTPRIRVDILIDDNVVNLVLESLKCSIIKGSYWLTNVEEFGQL